MTKLRSNAEEDTTGLHDEVQRNPDEKEAACSRDQDKE